MLSDLRVACEPNMKSIPRQADRDHSPPREAIFCGRRRSQYTWSNLVGLFAPLKPPGEKYVRNRHDGVAASLGRRHPSRGTAVGGLTYRFGFAAKRPLQQRSMKEVQYRGSDAIPADRSVRAASASASLGKTCSM